MLKLKKIPVSNSGRELEKSVGSDYVFAPSFSLNDSQVPEIDDWEVGETYTMVIDVKMRSKSAYEKSTTNASFDIVAYKVMDDMENMSDADIEEMQGQALSNK